MLWNDLRAGLNREQFQNQLSRDGKSHIFDVLTSKTFVLGLLFYINY